MSDDMKMVDIPTVASYAGGASPGGAYSFVTLLIEGNLVQYVPTTPRPADPAQPHMKPWRDAVDVLLRRTDRSAIEALLAGPAQPVVASIQKLSMEAERMRFATIADAHGWTPGDFVLGAYAGWLAAKQDVALKIEAPVVAVTEPDVCEKAISDSDRMDWLAKHWMQRLVWFNGELDCWMSPGRFEHSTLRDAIDACFPERRSTQEVHQ